MAKLGDVLKRQFAKLGIEITDELKPLTELDAVVTDDVANKIDTGLLTIEAAKTNPEVTKAVKAASLNGIDARLDQIIKETGVTVDEAYANEKNTFEKVAMLSKALYEHGRKKGESNSKEGLSETVKKEREQWQLKEAQLQNELKSLKDTLTNKETEFKSTRETDLTSMELFKKLFGKDYVFPKDMDSDLKVTTALSALKKDLETQGLVVKRNEAGVLVITDKEGQPAYTKNHELISDVDSFIDGVLTRNKLLNVNDPNAQQQNSSSGSAGAGGGQLNGGANNQNNAIVNELSAQVKNMPA